MTTIEKKENINLFIDNFTDKQIDFLFNILEYSNYYKNKGKLMQIVFDNNTNNIDTAIPYQFSNEVRNLGLDSFYLCMNYKSSGGKINNLAELFIEKMLNELEVK